MSMPGIYDCIIKRHPTLDPSIIVPHDQQPGPSGHQPPKPNKYVSLESIALKLLSVEYDFLRALFYVVETSEHLYGLSSMTDLPDETCVHQERICPLWIILEVNYQQNCFPYTIHLVYGCEK